MCRGQFTWPRLGLVVERNTDPVQHGRNATTGCDGQVGERTCVARDDLGGNGPTVHGDELQAWVAAHRTSDLCNIRQRQLHVSLACSSIETAKRTVELHGSTGLRRSSAFQSRRRPAGAAREGRKSDQQRPANRGGHEQHLCLGAGIEITDANGLHPVRRPEQIRRVSR